MNSEGNAEGVKQGKENTPPRKKTKAASQEAWWDELDEPVAVRSSLCSQTLPHIIRSNDELLLTLFIGSLILSSLHPDVSSTQCKFFTDHIVSCHISKLNRRRDDYTLPWRLGYSKLKTLPCQHCQKVATRFCHGCSDLEKKRIVAFCASSDCQRNYHIDHFHFDWFAEEWHFVN